MATESKWADGPFKLIPSPKSRLLDTPDTYIANEMSIAHNMYLLPLNAIYVQAPHITTTKDKKNFLQYCIFWIDAIEQHHTIEEEVLFPEIEKYSVKGIMDSNVQEHETFVKEMKGFEEYVRKTFETPEKLDGNELRVLIDRFGKELTDHLHAEIDTLLSLKEYDPECNEARKAQDLCLARLQAQSSITVELPFALSGRDVTYENGINGKFEFPWFIPYLTSWVFSRKHKEAWEFAPCDFHGNPKPLRTGA
ncbi:hypothetical protein FQN52_003006 [Onygenales sp. PD_12]|nr:hypothetical protein FQN52_003006 [Onygenales sp. PD_12]